MRQTTKRFDGIIAMVAIISGLTGAFALSVAKGDFTRNNNQDDEIIGKAQNSDASFIQTSNISATPQQHIDLTGAAEMACNAVVYIQVGIE